MGSQKIQGTLWGKRPTDWAVIQEPTGLVGYEYVLQYLPIGKGIKLLDVGCGSGLFSDLAFHRGAAVEAIDASEELIGQAKIRNAKIPFTVGEMEELPFEANSFDVVCGFNSFQYAASVPNAFREARRVLKKQGKITVMIWGNKEDCEAGSYLKAVGSLLPPPPPGAGGPFALSENRMLETLLESADFKIIDQHDHPSVWDYPDTQTAMKGLLAAGPAARAIEHSGLATVEETIQAAMQPYIQDSGHVVYKNKVRIVIAEKTGI